MIDNNEIFAANCRQMSPDSEELYEEYMSLDKGTLARMLVERDKFSPFRKEDKVYPVNLRSGRVCTSWSDCTNPQMDCIDCPLRNAGGGRAWTTDFCSDQFNRNLNTQSNKLQV